MGLLDCAEDSQKRKGQEIKGGHHPPGSHARILLNALVVVAPWGSGVEEVVGWERPQEVRCWCCLSPVPLSPAPPWCHAMVLAALDSDCLIPILALSLSPVGQLWGNASTC